MIVVEIFSKDDCHLCERAKTTLREIQKRHPFELREILLREGDARFEEYGQRVPVIVVNNVVTFQYRVPEAEFIRHLQTLSLRAS